MPNTPLQRKLTWSWAIGGITLFIAAYLLENNDSYAWTIPMLIGMSIVKYLRDGIDIDKNNIFHHMGGSMKLFTALYSLLLAGLIAYSVIATPELIANNTGIFMVLAMAPFIVVALKIDLKLFIEPGTRKD